MKPNHTGSGGHRHPFLRNGTVTIRNVSVTPILSVAYGLIEVRVAGPAWHDTEYFDLSAKTRQGVAGDQIMPMLQALLKERFHA